MSYLGYSLLAVVLALVALNIYLLPRRWVVRTVYAPLRDASFWGGKPVPLPLYVEIGRYRWWWVARAMAWWCERQSRDIYADLRRI